MCAAHVVRKWGSLSGRWSSSGKVRRGLLISSACFRSYGSAWDSQRYENLGCAAVCEQTCAPAGMSGAQ